MNIENSKIAIIGLGYVGLPLAIEFGKKFITIGYDIDNHRIYDLKKNIDKTKETKKIDFFRSKKLKFTNKLVEIAECNIFIVTVPTPINSNKTPDLSFLKKASKDLGKIIKKKSIVIYESTVYPGVTEDICIPIIEKISKLKLNKDFYAGYSPERINPGDKEHRLTDIVKVTSGSNKYASRLIDELYKKIIKAGTFKALSIKTAEAAKVIENTQRDLNISLMNELSIIFDKLGLDSQSVIDTAATKWNFQKFKPGLVGGHCIGVDPYYLTYKSKEIGYEPKVILAGRKINDSMATNIANRIFKKMKLKKISFKKSKVLILGYTFKENCPDTRNTKVLDLITSLQKKITNCNVYDPYIKSQKNEININFLKKMPINDNYDILVLAVRHNEFLKISEKNLSKIMTSNKIIFDLQNVFPRKITDGRL
jgi:UDP-N-acetyl-D-galactosamine dehydrogenase